MPGNMSQNGAKNLSHLWRHSQKTRNPNPKNFLITDSKTCRVFWGFEQHSSTIDWQVVELVNGARLAAQCMIFRYDLFIHRQQTC